MHTYILRHFHRHALIRQLTQSTQMKKKTRTHTHRFDIEARHFEWQSNRTENVKDTMIAVLFTI